MCKTVRWTERAVTKPANEWNAHKPVYNLCIKEVKKNMAKIDPEMRPLSSKEREFIHQICYQGLSREEAYSTVSEIEYTEENMKKIKRAASSMFFRPHVYNYYQALMEEIRDKDTSKAVWTKEVATEKLMRLINKAEEDLYGDEKNGITPKQMTMSRINAIVLPAKELNLMHGYNNTNVNVGGGVVINFTGEDEIPE